MSDRYARQVLLPFVGRVGQAQLGTSRVTLVGCGALGTGIANTLVRAGVGHVRICDRDVVELGNLHRQILFSESDIGVPKAEAAARHLRTVNTEVTIEAVVADVNFTNVEALTSDADLVIDGTDNFETRYLLNDAAVKLGKPWVYGGVVGSGGLVMPIAPGRTACLRCVFPTPPSAGSEPTCDTAGVLNAASLTIAALESAEALKLLLGDTAALLAGLLEIDVWANRFRQVNVTRDPDCVCCVQRQFPYLTGEAGALLTTLCGRNAVQIVQRQAQTLDLQAMRDTFAKLGEVTANKFLLRVSFGAHDITLFADGRALIGGTTDASVAKSVYARYVGQ